MLAKGAGVRGSGAMSALVEFIGLPAPTVVNSRRMFNDASQGFAADRAWLAGLFVAASGKDGDAGVSSR